MMKKVVQNLPQVFDYDMIPVVFGSANFSKMAPKKSFINVDDFQTVDEFVRHVRFLAENATAFAEYFEWKNYFKVTKLENFFFSSQNKLERLNDVLLVRLGAYPDSEASKSCYTWPLLENIRLG
jgi:hypothetical protein